MSNNAVAARSSGRLPATDAAREWGFKSAKALREVISSNEWHHTSKKFNITYFYDVEEKYNDCNLQDFAAIFPNLNKRGKEIAKEFVKKKIKENLNDSPEITNLQWKAGYFHNRRRKQARRSK